ncbi:hypothetical protein [Mariniradius sediminis]|uniref:Uncharacterized protein n=1 Tax=Mariniradius sediminis TaxID=2909237 RepID=A0ABS9BW85_9BACT|nr:hypothetical protein [Mariniradius sediminis]MCF1752323.1 hypothetical protein [Mariniradius sediminis]
MEDASCPKAGSLFFDTGNRSSFLNTAGFLLLSHIESTLPNWRWTGHALGMDWRKTGQASGGSRVVLGCHLDDGGVIVG